MNFKNIHFTIAILVGLSLLGTGCMKKAQVNQVNNTHRYSSSTISTPSTTQSSTTRSPNTTTLETNRILATYEYFGNGSFKFKYPGILQGIMHYISKPGTFKDEERTIKTTGEATQLHFSTKQGDEQYFDFNVSIQSLGYQTTYYEKYDSYDLAWANKIDFTKTNEQIAADLVPKNTNIIKIEKLTADGIQGVKLELYEEPYDYNKTYYIFPKFNPTHSLNLVISTDPAHTSLLQEIIRTLTFDKRI